MDQGGSLYRVRLAAPADEAAWRGLWDAYCKFYAVSIPADVTGSLWRRIVDPAMPLHAVIAESAGGHGRNELVGFANYVLHPYTWGTGLMCYMEDLFVVEHARGKGAGSALIGRLLQMAKQNGWPRVYWHTHCLNEVARSLYDKFTPPDPFVRYVVNVK